VHKDRIKTSRVGMSNVNWIMEVSKNNNNKQLLSCNVNKKRHFLNHCFNSILLVFYMFQTPYVHHQEDYIVHAALYATFFMHLCKQFSRVEEVLDTDIDVEHIKLQSVIF
jgi:hypothetical protein